MTEIFGRGLWCHWRCAVVMICEAWVVRGQISLYSRHCAGLYVVGWTKKNLLLALLILKYWQHSVDVRSSRVLQWLL